MSGFLRARRLAVPAALLAGLLATLTAEARSPAAAFAPPTGTVAYYSFDRGVPGADDSGHGHPLRIVSSGGVSVRAEERPGHGAAAAFPQPCRTQVEPLDRAVRGCPQAILEAPHHPELNPGRRDFAWGAALRLTAESTTPGENVFQKGYRDIGGQFKLQVDGRAGRPSCVLTETGTARWYGVLGSDSIADGRWHTVECRRAGTSLSIAVDGSVRATMALPPGVLISPGTSLRIGGKHIGPENDQFHGAVDDAYLAIV